MKVNMPFATNKAFICAEDKKLHKAITGLSLIRQSFFVKKQGHVE